MADLDITITYGDLTQQVVKADYGATNLRPDASSRSALLNDIGVALTALAEAAGVYDSYVEMMAKAKTAMKPDDFTQLAASQPADMQAKLATAGLVAPPAEAAKPAVPLAEPV